VPGILEILDRNGIHDGLIVDLGCGSGLWARGLVDAGYRVLGIDISEAMIVEREEDVERGTMERRIVSFRKAGECYRRDEEVHRVRLYDPAELSAELERAGFRVRTMRSYGDFPLSEGHAAFVARKPA
jgi:SAM-dependent methyltransferase